MPGADLLGVLGGMGPLAGGTFVTRLVALTPAGCDQEHIPLVLCNDPRVPDRSSARLGQGEDPLAAMMVGIRRLEGAAIKRLLEDVRKGLVNTIVVYKIDRLSRSLADFAKLVELFDHYKVTFVSVTQSFNTTTSMGRLTLNILLSFKWSREDLWKKWARNPIISKDLKLNFDSVLVKLVQVLLNPNYDERPSITEDKNRLLSLLKECDASAYLSLNMYIDQANSAEIVNEEAGWPYMDNLVAKVNKLFESDN